MGAVLYLICGLSLTTTVVFANGVRTQQLLSMSVEEFSERIIPYVIRQRTNGTSLYCQMLCLRDEECLSFFHNSITGICQTHRVVFFNPDDGQLSPGSRYYRQVQELCPSDLGYIYNRALDLCYKLHYLNPGNYYHADQECKNEGGNLVIVDTKEKLDLIVRTIKSSTFPANQWPGFLIGATDEGYSAQDWHWTNGGQVDLSIFTWCPNEPNSPGSQHHIAIVLYHPPSCINDVGTDNKHFICERQM